MVPTAGALGTGRECPTTRNFNMVDQDPSDNVTTKYLLNPVTGQTAQDDTANEAHMRGATPLVNGSDNALIDDFLDPALGCTPFEAPDLGNHGTMATSQALDELLAARNQPKNAALVPESSNEMVVDNGGQLDQAKTDLYRSEIGQAPVDDQTDATAARSTRTWSTSRRRSSRPMRTCSPPVPRRCPRWATPCSPSWRTGWHRPSTTSTARTSAWPIPSPSSWTRAARATEATLNTAPQEASF